jgi:HK97 family phage prohead protease
MDGEVERRFIGPFDNVESPDFDMLTVEERADEPGGRPKTYLVGYAAVFGQDSVLLGDFIERIEPSAFEIVKSGKDKRGKPLATRGLFNHDPNHLLGRYPVTMRMWVDEKGLKYEILLPESRRDIAESVRRGDLRGSSFSFVVAPGGEKWHYENGQSIRTVTAIKSLVDCGPVTYPAYEASSVAVAQRSLQAFKSRGDSGESRRSAVRASIMGEVKKCRELLESRDCGRGEGGKFGSGNTCQAGGDDGVDKKASDKNIATKALGQYNSGTSKDESGMDTPGGTGGAAVGAFTWGTIGAGFGAIAGLPGIAAGLIIGTVAGGLAGRIASEKAAKTYDSLKKSAGVSDDQIVKASKAMSPTGGSKGTVFVTDDMGGIGITGEKNSEIAVLTSGNKGTALSYYNDKKSVEPSIGRAISVAKTLNADMVSLTANNGNDAKALEKAGFEKVSDKAYVKTLGKKSKRSDPPIAETYDGLVNFLAERRAAECGQDNDGRFGKGNTCAGGGGGAKIPSSGGSSDEQKIAGWMKASKAATSSGLMNDKQFNQVVGEVGEGPQIDVSYGDGVMINYEKGSNFYIEKHEGGSKVSLFPGNMLVKGEGVAVSSTVNSGDVKKAEGIAEAAGASAVHVYANEGDSESESVLKSAGYKEASGKYVAKGLKFFEKSVNSTGKRHDDLLNFLAERRAAGCGQDNDGKFGKGNTCAGDGGGNVAFPNRPDAAKAGSAFGGILGASVGGAVGGLAGAAAGVVVGVIAGAFGGVRAGEQAVNTYRSLKSKSGLTDEKLSNLVNSISGGKGGHVMVVDDPHSDSKSIFAMSADGANGVTITPSGDSVKVNVYSPGDMTPKKLDEAVKVAKSLGATMAAVMIDDIGDDLSKQSSMLENAGFIRAGRGSDEYIRAIPKTNKRSADCGRGGNGRFDSGNKCAAGEGGGGDDDEPTSKGGGSKAEGSTPASGDSKYMEWKKGDHKVPGKTEKAQSFMDKARKDQTITAGKDGGKSDDGGGVQTWSKGDSFPWTVKQVGDVDGHMQGIHPDGSKTEKYKFYGGDTKEASKKLAEEIAKRKKAK